MNTYFCIFLLGNGISEQLFTGYRTHRFNYTLYSYDRAGNLTRTVPPEGVRFMANNQLQNVNTQRTANNIITPGHFKSSLYRYNSLNQVYQQSTPDGGTVDYFYDAAGRVIFSQNAKQKLTGDMTYTLYDDQGRIAETGQVNAVCTPYFVPYHAPSNSVPPAYSCARYDHIAKQYTPYPVEVNSLKHYTHADVRNFVRSLNRTEVVYTHYDTAAVVLSASPGMSPQENLRKRVSAIKYFDHLLASDAGAQHYDYAMHFSYDIAGNVKSLVRDYPAWKQVHQQFKRVDYDYDVISGKVNLLSYNRGFADQYFQRYGYDDDNRITQVESSSDGYIWMRDAAYQYYQHGPLARMSLGDLRVQGVDYAYTIQGWLKAINGDLLDSLKDMGLDGKGSSNSIHAYDAAALTLDYFKGDYRPIGSTAVTNIAAPSKSLYNGNIPRATTALRPFPDLASNYTYDLPYALGASFLDCRDRAENEKVGYNSADLFIICRTRARVRAPAGDNIHLIHFY